MFKNQITNQITARLFNHERKPIDNRYKGISLSSCGFFATTGGVIDE